MADDKHTKSKTRLNDMVLSLREKARERAQNAIIEDAQLPIWPEAARALPNGLLRSALFGAIRKGGRRVCNSEVFPSPKGIEICYTGERLDQSDLTTYETILHIAKCQNLGSKVYFTTYAALKLMGKTDSGKNRQVFHKQIERLVSGAVKIHQGSAFYIGSLVNDAFKDKETQEWVVTLNPRLRELYGNGQYTHFDAAVRRDLEGKPLAQWLYGFYSSHSNPHPISMDTLLRLSASENANKRSAYQTLRKALDTVVATCQKKGEKFYYEVKEHLVYVKRH